MGPSPCSGALLVVSYATGPHAADMTPERLREALDSYTQAQDELVGSRNRLAQAIAGAAMSGLTQAEIVELTGYPADLVLRICTDAGVSGTDG